MPKGMMEHAQKHAAYIELKVDDENYGRIPRLWRDKCTGCYLERISQLQLAAISLKISMIESAQFCFARV